MEAASVLLKSCFQGSFFAGTEAGNPSGKRAAWDVETVPVTQPPPLLSSPRASSPRLPVAAAPETPRYHLPVPANTARRLRASRAPSRR